MKFSDTSIDAVKTGNRLKLLAKYHGYSVKDIQEYLGLSCPQSIYRWYKGIILPSIDNLFCLSKLYHLHMEELLVTKSEESDFSIDKMQNNIDHCAERLFSYQKMFVA